MEHPYSVDCSCSNIYVTYIEVIQLARCEEYLDEDGVSPYAEWFNTLPAQAAAKIAIQKLRLEQGNMSSVEGVGEGVLEKKIDWGPGYRIYFGKDGEELILLLGGGTKKRQQRDIETAQERWKDYKQRKRKEQRPWR
jgi:putative addiction module killer protein